MSTALPYDPKGLIKEAFAIEGIRAEECRSIFLDWALGLPEGRDPKVEVARLIDHFAPSADAAHPMLETLIAARDGSATPRRRGGRQARMT